MSRSKFIITIVFFWCFIIFVSRYFVVAVEIFVFVFVLFLHGHSVLFFLLRLCTNLFIFDDARSSSCAFAHSFEVRNVVLCADIYIYICEREYNLVFEFESSEKAVLLKDQYCKQKWKGEVYSYVVNRCMHLTRAHKSSRLLACDFAECRMKIYCF